MLLLLLLFHQLQKIKELKNNFFFFFFFVFILTTKVKYKQTNKKKKWNIKLFLCTLYHHYHYHLSLSLILSFTGPCKTKISNWNLKSGKRRKDTIWMEMERWREREGPGRDVEQITWLFVVVVVFCAKWLWIAFV